jgi:hypothetical protein
MPNHCYNILSLSESPKKTSKVLKKFLTKDKTGGEFFDFNKVIKMPKDLDVESTSAPDKDLEKKYKENIKKYGCKTWYEWCVENWGTKWNSYDFQLQDSCASFSTAWSPPEPIIIELAQKTQEDWVLRYYEEGMSFCGELFANKTGEIHHNTWELKDSPQEFRDEVGLTPEDIYSEEELEEMRAKEERLKKLKKTVIKGVKSKPDDQLKHFDL